MPGVVVLCPDHGLVESSVIQYSDGGRVTASGGVGSNCPICGRDAPIVDGEYQEGPTGTMQARLLLTQAQVDQLRGAIIWARQSQRRGTETEAIARHLEGQLDEVVPQARGFLNAATGKTAMAATAYLSVLISLIMLFIALGPTKDLSEQDVERIVREAVQTSQNSQERTEQERPTPQEAVQSPPQQPPPVSEIPTPETH